MKVAVTGAAGYIGGQTVLALTDAGHQVLGIDREHPSELLVSLPDTWWSVNDFASDVGLAAIHMWQPEAIVHCAGTSLVGPSVANPEEYYNNNFVKTKRLLDFLVQAEMTKVRVIFSSSAATYGEPETLPCVETDVTVPISPYGQSKLMVDWALQSYHQAYGLDYVSFRYFNACGADSQARHGQAPGATHLIARVLEAMRDDREFVLNGIDFDTPDGTCVRDYVHVEDIARAHVRALDADIEPRIYNLGSNNGTSNREIISAALRVTGRKLKVVLGNARPGDPARLTASAAKFGLAAGDWRHYTLDDMIAHAWAWYTR
jgi:UDP-glucose 4-epimerase